MTKKYYGWKPSLPDFRDFYYTAPRGLAIPNELDLRPKCPPIFNQRNLGSCTAQAIAALAQFLMIKEGHESFTPSRLFIYYLERLMEGTINQDAGANIRDGMKVVNQNGCPHETLWPYFPSSFAFRPNKATFKDGLKYKVLQYSRIDNTKLNDIKTCLAEGYPVVGGFTVYDSFESNEVARTGVVPMPAKNESVQGGHAILIVGFLDEKQCFIVRNSWGKSWGDKGCFYMKYEYFTNPQLADDFWSAKIIT